MPHPLTSLVERGLAESYIKGGKKRIRLTHQGKQSAHAKIGIRGDLVDYFARKLGNARVRKKECSPDYLHNRVYATILSVIYTRSKGAIRGRNVLEIGPGNRTKQLEILHEDGANIFSFEPKASERLKRVSQNAENMFDIANAHNGAKFDFVISSKVFEKYAAENYEGLESLKNKKKRSRFWRELNKRMNDNATLVLTDSLPNQKKLILKEELEEAGFQIVTDSAVMLEPRAGDYFSDLSDERFIIARKKPKSHRRNQQP